jgi:hypothetical protein
VAGGVARDVSYGAFLSAAWRRGARSRHAFDLNVLQMPKNAPRMIWLKEKRPFL